MKDDFELYLEADKEKEEYKKLYFEELKRSNELHTEKEDYRKMLYETRCIFGTTLYTIMCILLIHTYESVLDTILKIFVCPFMLIPIFWISGFVYFFGFSDFENNKTSTKRKVLTIIGVLIIIPALVLLLMNMPPID